MSSVTAFVAESRQVLQMRPILPFGLSLTVGDVVDVQSDGSVSLVGRITDFIEFPDVSAIDPLPPAATGSVQVTSGDDVNVQIGATVGTPLPVNAHVLVDFSSSDSFAAFISQPTLSTMRSPVRLHEPLLQFAYAHPDRWKESYVVVTQTSTPKHWLGLFSQDRGASVTLGVQADVQLPTGGGVDLAAQLDVTAQSKASLVYKSTDQPAFINGLQIKGDWWTGQLGINMFGLDPDAAASAFHEIGTTPAFGENGGA